MTWAWPIRVVGVGSPQGDDAVGRAVILGLCDQISRRSVVDPWWQEIELFMAEGGQRLLDLCEATGSLIVIDAASGGPAGSIHRFDWPQLPAEQLRPGSTHDLKPAEALQLAETLGILQGKVVIWAIEGECFEPQADLSSAVAARIPDLVQRIMRELETIP